MAWIAPVVGAASSLIGDLFNQSGQNSANATNIMLAQQNRDWETQMSNTAHQREAADLKAAGINPILTGMRTGASTPSMSPAQVQNPNAGFSRLGDQVTSALGLRTQEADINLKNAQAENLRGSTLPPGQAAASAQAGATQQMASAHQADAQTQQIKQGLENLAQQLKLLAEQTKGQALSNQNYQALTDMRLRLDRLEAQGRQLGMPVKQLESDAAKAALSVSAQASGQSSGPLTHAGEWVGNKVADLHDFIMNAFSGKVPDAPKDWNRKFRK